MSDTPEESDYTSIQERISPQFNLTEAVKNQFSVHDPERPIKPFLHFDDDHREHQQTGIPFSLRDYLQLVDWTGRAILQNKRGSVARILPTILIRLGIDTNHCLTNSQNFEKVEHRRFKKSA